MVAMSIERIPVVHRCRREYLGHRLKLIHPEAYTKLSYISPWSGAAINQEMIPNSVLIGRISILVTYIVGSGNQKF